ncbi:MAG: ABC transporter permease [Flavobacteriaceae bacterium]|nr:ABC transporter permease [Flavobacteriaceae bacterium]
MFKFIFDRDTWQEIYGSIRKNKLRTAITIIGVMWGIFLLVVLLGAARGVENNFNKIFGNFATNSVFVWSQQTGKAFKGYQKGRNVQLKQADVYAITKNIKGIEKVVPRNLTDSQIVRGLKVVSSGIYGDYPTLNEVQKKNMVYGRFINQNDILDRKKVCVIKSDLYKQLFEEDENPIGQYIKINNISYQVVGMYEEKFGSGGPNGDVHIPFTTFQQTYNMGDNIGWMMITGKSEFNIIQIEADIKLLLKTIHKVHPDDSRAFGSFNLGNEIKKITGFLIGMQFLTWFVGIATLIAGVFAIGNILLITVKERTKEIGIRRAIGARPIEIKRQIVLESVFLTTIAGSLGIIFGGLVLMLIDTFAGHGDNATLTNPTVNIPVVMFAYVMLVTLGTLVGLIPASIATSIKPIEALSDE